MPRDEVLENLKVDLPPLARVLLPQTDLPWATIEEKLKSLRGPSVDVDALEIQLRRHLALTLLRFFHRTLVLELNIARLREKLSGETPQERFESFVADLVGNDKAWAELLSDYPVLATLLERARAQWIDHVGEILTHLQEDWPRLCDLFAWPADGLRLTAMASEPSDPHCGGRGVWQLEFTRRDGAAAEKVIYKPKSLAVDLHFQALLAWVNAQIDQGLVPLERGATGAAAALPKFATMRVLDRGAYGWSEFIDARPCRDRAEVQRFYLRQGAYLALLHVLDGVDMHHENIIASGEHPFFVDLEMLFHPITTDAIDDSAHAHAVAYLNGSLARLSLLPNRAYGDAANPGVNIGGLGSGEAQLTPTPVPVLQDIGADTMHLASARLRMDVAKNVPSLGGRFESMSQYTRELCAGFAAMLGFIAKSRDEWLRAGGLLDAFADDPVRRLFRPTAVYAQLSHTSLHPDYLRDPADRAALFAKLDQVDARKLALLRGVDAARVIAAEKLDLDGGDIPFFSGTVAGRDMWDSRRVRTPDFFAGDALSKVKARLRALDAGAIAAERWVLDGSLAAAAFAAGAPSERIFLSDKAAHSPALAMAVEIGERLAKLAIRGRAGAVTWLGADYSNTDDDRVLAPVGPDLYTGEAGIAIFLAYLGHLSGEKKFSELAVATCASIKETIPKLPRNYPQGGFLGIPSHLYALGQVQSLLNVRVLDEALEAAFAGLTGQPESESPFDIMYGAAGAILAFLSVFHGTGDARMLEYAIKNAEVLGAGAKIDGKGAAWPTVRFRQPLLGFSHGVAGIVAALDALVEVAHQHDAAPATTIDEWRQLSDRALAYENAYFDAARNNWPDLRPLNHEPSGEPRFLVNWCHGAPGIALGRLVGLDVGEERRRDVRAALTCWLNAPATKSHVLCHSELSNLLIAQEAATRLGDAELSAHVAGRAARVIEDVVAHGADSDFPFVDANPSLMIGTAGIGFGLLALAHPGKVPLVLALAPPLKVVN